MENGYISFCIQYQLESFLTNISLCISVVYAFSNIYVMTVTQEVRLHVRHDMPVTVTYIDTEYTYL